MNTKTAVLVLGGIIVLTVAFLVLNRPASPTPFTTTPTNTESTSTQSISVTPAKVTPSAPVVTIKTPVSAQPSVQVTSQTNKPSNKIAAFDHLHMVTNSTHPTYTGTANVASVSVIVINSSGVGISGSWNIPVIGGTWKYTAPQGLTPGNYSIQLLGGEEPVMGSLTVTP